MDTDKSRYTILTLIYDVTLDLSKALENELENGGRDYDKIQVLSGCYSIVDYTANLIGTFGIDDEGYPDSIVKSDHFLAAPKLMETIALELENNLCDDRCPGVIDYKKVQALVGLRSVIPYLEQLTKILED